MIHLFNTNFSSSSALRLINKLQECVDNIQFVRLFVFHFLIKKAGAKETMTTDSDDLYRSLAVSCCPGALIFQPVVLRSAKYSAFTQNREIVVQLPRKAL